MRGHSAPFDASFTKFVLVLMITQLSYLVVEFLLEVEYFTERRREARFVRCQIAFDKTSWVVVPCSSRLWPWLAEILGYVLCHILQLVAYFVIFIARPRWIFPCFDRKGREHEADDQEAGEPLNSK